MVCKNYAELSPLEKVMFIGELTHACMFDETLYEMGKGIINIASEKGMFNNVTIMPSDDGILLNTEL